MSCILILKRTCCSFFVLSILVSISITFPAYGEVTAKDDVGGSNALDASKVTIGSVKAAVFDLSSGEILFSKHADWVTPIASITKVMTALVLLDSEQPLNAWLEIPEPDLETRKNAYSRMRIGSKLKRSELLKLALMSSENLAAYTLAYHHPGGVVAFVADMNNKAKRLNMFDSTFVDPSGLSKLNVATASDLVKLLSAAEKYEKIKQYSTESRYTARFKHPRYSLNYGNTNRLVRRDSWDITLSKTGYITESGRCLVLMSKLDGKEVGMVFLDAFGKITPLGDAARVKRWITTGQGGYIAGAALRYAQDKAKDYQQLGRTQKALQEASMAEKVSIK
jgi:D-alanyl-D-alanine endopeptidase (penicillin-binding protein 7)